MSEFTQVTEYVDRVFKLYDADRLGFFEDFNDEGIDTVEIPLFLLPELPFPHFQRNNHKNVGISK